MAIHKRALCIGVFRSQPKMRKLDRPTTFEVQELKKASAQTAKVWKELYGRKNRMSIESPVHELRSLVKLISHPWLVENKLRIIALSLYEKYEKALARLVENVRIADTAAIQNFSQWREDGRILLGEMFREDDYPTESEFANQFRINVDVTPVPISVPSNHIYNLFEDDKKADLDALREILENAEKENLRCVTESCATQIFDATSHIIEAINHKQAPARASEKRAKTYHDTMIGRVWDLVQLLPELNLADSQEISDLHSELKTKILKRLELDDVQAHEKDRRVKTEMKRMKENRNLENEIKKNAQEIMEKAAVLIPKTDEA